MYFMIAMIALSGSEVEDAPARARAWASAGRPKRPRSAGEYASARVAASRASRQAAAARAVLTQRKNGGGGGGAAECPPLPQPYGGKALLALGVISAPGHRFRRQWLRRLTVASSVDAGAAVDAAAAAADGERRYLP